MSLARTPPPPPWRSNRATHLFLFTCLALVGVVATWAAYGKLDIVSNATGTVVPASHVQEVQHLEGGIVAELLIDQGDKVTEGQPLVVLETTTSGADVARMQVRLDGHRIDLARLMAEANEDDSVTFPEPLTTTRPALINRAQTLFQARQSRLNGQLKAQDQAIEQRQFEVREVSARLQGNRRNLKLLNEQLVISRKLLKLDLTNRLKHLDLEREAAALKGKIAEDDQLLPRTRSALEEARTRRTALRQAFVEEARGKLQEVQVAAAELVEALRKAEDSLQRTVLRSPTEGVVKTLHMRNVGGVVRPGMVVAEVVPSDDRMVIEARLPTADVGYVHEGQKAIVRLASADGLRFGGLTGKVVAISPDAHLTDDGSPYYQVRVETEADHFAKGDLRYDLIPGMQVQCAIQTGTRSVYEYFLDPYLTAFRQALRER
ncbi:HlyD family type I secretion periplasmic adaptor subunit [Magnetospira sp. QH-2]|uniref:HlyD family type I secretion periplasmic adaptor subunit n=1 Tax=Magnetospira sp. (strain QH-2) TaxID=1288970 RepID=UPI0003E81250|nr:HlyD family type I secretion periplasmic adaptor subunit [Magnetospira sp. QH-2]CCQ73211.1 putative type I secretion membrane fusion protein, HlyD family [Magnetospira sp. QH-2]